MRMDDFEALPQGMTNVKVNRIGLRNLAGVVRVVMELEELESGRAWIWETTMGELDLVFDPNA